MRANHLVDIQQNQEADDTDNTADTEWEDVTATWTTVAQTFAEIIPLSGKELVDARQVHGDITHRIKMPYQADIKAYQRVKWGDRIFHQLGPPINKKEKNRWLELSCVERT